MNFNPLKRISASEFIAIGSIYLICAGLFYIITYYKLFGIDILSFLEVSEILTSFFDKIFFIILVMICLIGLWGSIIFIIIGNIQDRFSTMTFFKNKKLVFAYIILAITALVISYIYVRTLIVSFNHNTFFYMLIIILGSAFPMIVLSIYKYKNASFAFTIVSIFLPFILFSFLTFSVMASREASTVKKNKKYFGTIITLKNDEKIISDSSKYYIGKTNKYVFIYSEKTKGTQVVSMDEVKEFYFP